MLSFWPSLGLLVFFLVIFLECRAMAGRVTLPLGSFLTVFSYGAIGAPLLALLLQQIPILPDAGVDPAAPVAWLVGPPIEELAKALPVIVLAFLTRESRRLSIADLTLVGFASGAGFGFVEGNLDALVNGALPSLHHIAALGLQTETGAVFFAGHPVSTALVGLAAGIGLRFLPLNIAYSWAPAAFVILWASFDHGIYNWKLLNAANTGVLPDAHFIVEALHALTLKGQLATWLLPFGLIAGQFFEAYLCSKAVGARRDLLLAREWRPWVINEWLVALLRAPLGRAVFGQTLAYFRLRRAFYLAAFEARRDPGDPTWSRHARSLEERLKRERSVLFDPPSGTWLLPLPVLQTYAAQWTWRMRWVLLFAVLLLFLFMLDPGSLPEWLRQFLFGETFTITVVVAGLAFAVWRIVLFARLPPPDPLAAEGTAFTSFYTRQLLLGCSLLCGLFPTFALLFGWKAFAPGVAFISGSLPGWIGHGGNLQTLLGLGTIGCAVAPDPRPAGEAFHHEIAAGEERIRRLGWEIEDKAGTAENGPPGAARPLQLDGFLEAMAKLDAERDAQARRQLALDECERHAGEATIRDPAPSVQAVKDEFDRLASELLDAAAKELDAIASLEQAYGRAWSEIMQDLDAHDVLRRRLRIPLRRAWQAQNDIAWALRVVEATDEGLLPMQLTLLPELHALAITAQSARVDIVAAGIERIRAAAAAYGEADPFAFVGTDQADEDEAALLAEFVSAAPSTETPKAFGLRAPQPPQMPAHPADDAVAAAKPEPLEPETSSPVQARGQHYQEALDRLIGATKSDTRYFETISHLERADESLRQPIEPGDAEPQSTDRDANKGAQPRDPVESRALPTEDLPAAAASSEHQGELEDLIDAIKRNSGYLDFANGTQAAQTHDDRGQPEFSHSPPEALDTAVEAGKSPEVEASTADKDDSADEFPVASTSPEPISEREEAEETISAHLPEAAVAAIADAQPDQQATETAPQVVEHALSEESKPADGAAAPGQVDEPVMPQGGGAISPSVPSADAEGIGTEFETPADSGVSSSASLRAADAHAEAPEPQDISSHAKTVARGEVEEQTAIEPRRPTVEAKKPLDEPAQLLPTASVDDGPTAPQTAQRESESQTSTGETAAPTVDRLADFSSLKPDGVAAQAGETPLEPIKWPAPRSTADDDVPAQRSDTAPTRGDVAPVEKPAADEDVQALLKIAPTDAETLEIETVEPVESQAFERAAPDAHLADPDAHLADEAADVARAPESSPDQPETAVEDETAQPAATGTASDDTSAQAPKPYGVEEFASKADRLAQVIANLEHAMQAKTAAPSTPSEPPAAPVADGTAPSTTPASVADHSIPQTHASEPIAAEPEVVDPQQHPVEQTTQADQPDEQPVPLAEAPAEPEAVDPQQHPVEQTTRADQPDEQPVPLAEAPAEPAVADAPPVAPQPADEQNRAADTAPANTSWTSQELSDAQLKPDRLSFLLTKLFEAVKRQSTEQSVKTQQSEAEPALDDEVAPPSDAALESPAASEILDLRGPDPIPEPLDEAASDVPSEAKAPQDSAKVEEQPRVPETPDEPAVAPVQLQPAAADQTAAHDGAMPAEASEPVASQPVANTPDVSPAAAPTQPSEPPVEPRARPRAAEPATHFGSRSRPPRTATPSPERDAGPELSATERSPKPAAPETLSTTPKRDWKLRSGSPSRGETPKAAEPQGGDPETAKKTETTFRVKTGSGALATVDAAPPGLSATAEKTSGKYYGPRHAAPADLEAEADKPAQQRALSLADALTEYYTKTSEPQPPMYTTDRATLQRIITHGRLEAPRRRGAPWSISGMSRRGEVVIRLKPGAEQFVEFVPSKEIFGQVPHYYARGVGRGNYATHVPAGHLEHFDMTTRQWAPLQGN